MNLTKVAPFHNFAQVPFNKYILLTKNAHSFKSFFFKGKKIQL